VSVRSNINDYALVRLSPTGEEAFRKAWDCVSHVPSINVDAMLRRTDSEGRLRFQIHDLMHTFGPVCYLGGNSPFEGDIEFVETSDRNPTPASGRLFREDDDVAATE
jgi:hypothetical protein